MGVHSKDKRDIYYRLAKENNFRARSAYKLIHLSEKYNLFNEKIINIVDLCAAPGSWSQICVKNLYEQIQKDGNNNRRIIGVDLLKISNIEKNLDPLQICTFIEGDITDFKTIEAIVALLKTDSVDMVLCDGAPDVTGNNDFDEYYQNQLVLHALNTAIKLFKFNRIAHDDKNNKTFICKMFRGKETFNIYKHLQKYFCFVELAKPISCRNSSIESFYVCKGLKFCNENPLVLDESSHTGNNNTVELHVCGSGHDSDIVTENTSLSIKHQFPPINPAYKHIVDKRKKK
ncbi:putative tRNA (cytidine(32)/guanosine(34)-2'-O)-methyltransferase [Cucumispora dikerogammari]|nr:putative tRNA (cytidine(32)/guanosine(34)-2'-O)-methyltransferase [Cucumispora dikerogammari]